MVELDPIAGSAQHTNQAVALGAALLESLTAALRKTGFLGPEGERGLPAMRLLARQSLCLHHLAVHAAAAV